MKRVEILMGILTAFVLVNVFFTWKVYKELRRTQIREISVEETHLPKLIRSVRPEYPEEAKKRGIEGLVILKAHVDKTGSVSEVKILRSSGYAILDSAAISGVMQYKFEPPLQGGEPISTWVTIPVKFKLSD
jgi:TonB family protein